MKNVRVDFKSSRVRRGDQEDVESAEGTISTPCRVIVGVLPSAMRTLLSMVVRLSLHCLPGNVVHVRIPCIVFEQLLHVVDRRIDRRLRR